MLDRMRWSVPVLVVCGLFCVVTAWAEEIDNPAYKSWSQFKPGSFVTYKATIKMGAATTETKVTQTLKTVTPEKVVIEVSTVMTVAGEEVEQAGQPMEHLARIEKPKEGGAEAKKPKQIGEGRKEFNVNNRIIKTNWVKTEFTQAGNTATSTTWTSDRIPGGVVKTATAIKGPAAQGMPMTTELTLVDFKAEKE